ncbi:hypothetical protein GCM10008959_03600 [Deinococcus seoulensis]|uniref:Single-stranded DNA-binding protein n=1 Tax=Deinococcus seoulensis TaxID=1837379 RepID=A0ABQ2RN84_9DEIO|nr:hypothetical protein GCM10008959_03600 [Deinococcus seoulensis]
MNLGDVQPRLQAPFPAHVVSWKPAALSRDRSRALLLAHIDARAVQDRLDAICPADWTFRVEVIPGTSVPTVKGRLTVLGVAREDLGQAPDGDLSTLKAAASDALKRCAVHFGIGRYLYDLPRVWADWDDPTRQPVTTPELPDWARPEQERTPGGAHLVRILEDLRAGFPEDVDVQRDVWRHLNAALKCLHGQTGDAAPAPVNAVLSAAPSPADVTLTREGAARLHRQLGPLLPGLRDTDVKAWVGEVLGREITSFEQIRTAEIQGLKAAARDRRVAGQPDAQGQVA